MVSSISSSASIPLVNQSQTISKALNTNLQRLSSGSRIQSAADDAAGIAISSGLKASARIDSVALRNASDALSVSDIQASTLSSVSDIAAEVAALSTQAANGTFSDAQRQAINDQITQLTAEAGRQVQVAEFNGQSVFNGQTFQVGRTGGADDRISSGSVDPSAQTAVLAGVDGSSQAGAATGIDVANQVIGSIASTAGTVGAVANRIAAASGQIQVQQENALAAASRIEDADVAEVSSAFENSKIQQEINASALKRQGDAQRNILSLLA